jgi:hypothetical protein
MELKYRYDQEASASLIREGKSWMRKTQRIAQAFLPDESPLLEHLTSSYGQMYGDFADSEDTSKLASCCTSRAHSPLAQHKLDISLVTSTLKNKLKSRSSSRQSKRPSRIATPERKPIKKADLIIREIESIANEAYSTPDRSSKTSRLFPRFATKTQKRSELQQPEPTPPVEELYDEDFSMTSLTEADVVLTSKDLYGPAY